MWSRGWFAGEVSVPSILVYEVGSFSISDYHEVDEELLFERHDLNCSFVCSVLMVAPSRMHDSRCVVGRAAEPRSRPRP